MSDAIEDIRQMGGIYVGHSTNAEAGTGCTVVVCPDGAVGGVDVRGGAPATRETDLLRPEETVGCVHAVALSGGSAFGLAASCGVAEELERRGIGLDVGVSRVPIVTGACVFDLACGDPGVRPTAEDGAAAVADAFGSRAKPLPRGNVGAGTGCTVGKLSGIERAMKGGLGMGCASTGDLSCCAVAAVNACGDVVDPDTGRPIAGMRDPSGTALSSTTALLLEREATMPLARTNTTISCVVTNARLTKAQTTKVAQMSADAYAHAIRPTHTTNDGDTVFALATGGLDAPVDVIGALATRALELAIADAARQATSAYGYPSANDLKRNG